MKVRSAFAVLLVVACNKADPPKPSTTESRSASIDTSKKGLEASDNDPTLVKAARDVLACPSTVQLVDIECPAYKAFRSLPKKSDATLLNFVEDPQPAVRFLGATFIDDTLSFRADPAMARRLVVATATETNTRIAERLAVLTAAVDVEKTGQLDAITDIVRQRRIADVPTNIVGHLLGGNTRSRSVFDVTKGWAADPDPRIRRAAIRALWNGNQFEQETCDLVTKAASDHDADVVGQAVEHIGLRKCSDAADAAMFEAIQRAIGDGRVDGKLATALGTICERDKSDAAVRAKALAFAKKMNADVRLSSSIRKDGSAAAAKCEAATILAKQREKN